MYDYQNKIMENKKEDTSYLEKLAVKHILIFHVNLLCTTYKITMQKILTTKIKVKITVEKKNNFYPQCL